jgi:hypothetical protein
MLQGSERKLVNALLKGHLIHKIFDIKVINDKQAVENASTA